MSRSARSRSTRKYSPRNRTPATTPRPTVIASVRTRVEASSNLSNIGAAKIQRLSDGSTRILLTGQMGRAATHGYAVGESCTTWLGTVLVTTGESYDDYVIPAADWAALETEAAAAVAA